MDPTQLHAACSVPRGAPNVNRPDEAGNARWRTDAAGGDSVKLHVHAGAGAPPCQDDAVEIGLAGHAVRAAPDERREEVVSLVEFIDRLEPSDGVDGWVHGRLSLKKLAELGIARVSFGPGVLGLTLAHLKKAAITLTALGDYPEELGFEY